ncbi:hypothetical protein EDD18DRAFT_540346 [Armillaria luteobubalina]|uniref:F-box domain-containing protein n=1 Tax=Armillaria luteobubalina TaxID=153913 RepID=A0AA39UPI1_9AGAR|nr:hypothetical protein EDD18DRAFT_540346 [Armillaria luteobubalina]
MSSARAYESIIQPAVPTSILPAASPLPQELIDTIIDYLHNDARSLRACALIATSWLKRSQQNLFSQITLAERSSLHESKRLTLAEQFSRLIESAPHISTLVQHLVIIESDDIPSHASRWIERSISVLTNILPALTSLKTLNIDFDDSLWCDLPGIHAPFRSASKLRDLRKITISNLHIPSWDRLFALFEDSNVADLCLGNVTIDGLSGDHRQIYIPESVRIPLETLSLSLESRDLWRLPSWLANPSCILKLHVLRKLSIDILHSEEMNAFTRLLETLRIPSLQTIQIRLETLDSTSANHLPDISRFRHVHLLSALQDHLCESEEWISGSMVAHCWEQLLHNFRENVIETVTLMLPEIPSDKFPEAERMHWVALDAALTRADMTHLRCVYIKHERSQRLGYRDGVIKDMFPNLYEKGLLVF